MLELPTHMVTICVFYIDYMHMIHLHINPSFGNMCMLSMEMYTIINYICCLKSKKYTHNKCKIHSIKYTRIKCILEYQIDIMLNIT